MPHAQIFAMLAAIAGCGVVSRLLRVPYPVVMVVAGTAVAFVPGVPSLPLSPDLVFFVLLPPVLFAGGWGLDLADVLEFRRPILTLAIGLVVATTCAVAYGLAWLGALPLASAFVLGAILSPPDAVSAEAVADRVPFPRSVSIILKGESLANDATALVVYGLAVEAVRSGTFHSGSIALAFIAVSLGGIAIGFVVAGLLGAIMMLLRRRSLLDARTAVLITLVTPYLLYVPADALHASGVLAVVTGGIALSRKSERLFDPSTRIEIRGTWDVVAFVIDGVAFLATGLQLPGILHALRSDPDLTLGGYAAAAFGILVAVRFVWTGFFFIAQPHARWRSVPNAPGATWQEALILSWSGMRGIVTLAAALAIPTVTNTGAPFPGRDLIIFLAFTTIAATLVIQGLSLPWLVRAIGLPGEELDPALLRTTRARLARHARGELAGGADESDSAEERELIAGFASLLDRQSALADEAAERPEPDASADRGRAIRGKILHTQRTELLRLFEGGEIDHRVFHALQHEFDLMQSALEG